jgi:hypothetical protein
MGEWVQHVLMSSVLGCSQVPVILSLKAFFRS